MRLALLTVVTVATLGCSPIFVDGPPANHASRPSFNCTTSRAAPVIDTLLAVATGLPGLAVIAEEGNPFFLLPSAGFALSAGAGFSRTSECREALAELEDRQTKDRDDARTPARPEPRPPAGPRRPEVPRISPWDPIPPTSPSPAP